MQFVHDWACVLGVAGTPAPVAYLSLHSRAVLSVAAHRIQLALAIGHLCTGHAKLTGMALPLCGSCCHIRCLLLRTCCAREIGTLLVLGLCPRPVHSVQ
jgi:hypothetical protein